jgi:hypothetical protein
VDCRYEFIVLLRAAGRRWWEAPRLKAVNRSKTAALEVQVSDLLTDILPPLLDFGAAGRLLLSGELDRVLPLEDAVAMRAANPVKNGRIAPDAARIGARRTAMVKNLFDRGNVGVIVLGDSHSVTMLLPEGTEYSRDGEGHALKAKFLSPRHL